MLPEKRKTIEEGLVTSLTYIPSERLRYCLYAINEIGSKAFASIINRNPRFSVPNFTADGSYLLEIARSESRFDSNLLDLLLDHGADIHQTYETTQNNEKIQATIFTICCMAGNNALYLYLLNRKITPLQIHEPGNHPLAFLKRSYSFFKFAIDTAKKQGHLQQFVEATDEQGKNIFRVLLESKLVYSLHAIYLARYAPTAYKETNFDLTAFKKLAETALITPGKEDTYQLVLLHPTTARQQQLALEKFKSEFFTYNNKNTFLTSPTLFPEVKRTLAPLLRTQPDMYKAILDYATLLCKPQALMPILTRLANDLTREIVLAGKLADFNQASTEFSYRLINHYLYAIPNERYKKIPKDALLTKLLLRILQTADMGHRSTKWFNFIPKEVANTSIKEGHLFVESQFGIGTLHGKYTHMIQWAILIYALDMKLLVVPEPITAKSMIQTLVSIKEENSELYLWQSLIDMLMSKQTLGDPYRLTSLITTGFFGDACRTLEVYLRDSFCDSFLQWVRAYQEKLTKKISPDDFATLISLTDINAFTTSDYLIEKNNARHQHKLNTPGSYHTRNITMFSDSETNPTPDSMIIEKSHRPSSL